MNDIVVTVFCLTYNHEKYISRTLEGFVSQKTNFKFEVLVHDDASTDGTAGIVRSYEEKYPDTYNYYVHRLHRFQPEEQPEQSEQYSAQNK